MVPPAPPGAPQPDQPPRPPARLPSSSNSAPRPQLRNRTRVSSSRGARAPVFLARWRRPLRKYPRSLKEAYYRKVTYTSSATNIICPFNAVALQSVPPSVTLSAASSEAARPAPPPRPSKLLLLPPSPWTTASTRAARPPAATARPPAARTT